MEVVYIVKQLIYFKFIFYGCFFIILNYLNFLHFYFIVLKINIITRDLFLNNLISFNKAGQWMKNRRFYY